LAIQTIPAESRASAEGAFSPFLGNLADRFGAARTVAAGGLPYLAAMVMTAFATAPFALTLGNVLCGIGMAAAGFKPIFAGVRRRFLALPL
jgi:MFS family permease